MSLNEYVPFLSKILSVQKHTDIEYTFRMAYEGSVNPGQFFEVSVPKFGEAPISICGYGDGYVELTIRRVGKVTNEIFEHYEGDSLLLRGPYGNGFDLDEYRGKELVVIAGGTGLAPVRGVIDYFASNPDQVKNLKVIAGFKSPSDILFFEDIARWKKTSQVILTVDCGEADFECHIGFVTEHISKLKFADESNAVAIVVGPPAMMRFSTLELLKMGFEEENIWISLERRMCCGIGKCGHCKINDVYVCVDGPVFNYTKAKNLID